MLSGTALVVALVPVLLRDPLGNTLTSHTLSPPGPERSYFFTLPTENRPPWLEIHYPHQERRLTLDATGKWKSKEVIEQYGKVSGIPMPSTPEEYATYIAQEQAKWGAVVRAIGFKAE